MSKVERKRKIIIAIMTVVMIIGSIPMFSLAIAEDAGDTIQITANDNLVGGRIQVGTEISFNIKTEAPIDQIYYQWDRRFPDTKTKQAWDFLDEEYTDYDYKTTIPAKDVEGNDFLGLHCFSISVRVGNTYSKWLDVPFYVLNEDPGDYQNKGSVKFNLPSDYPDTRSEIEQGRKITIGLEDEDGVYWFAYKWTNGYEEDKDYVTGSTQIFNPGDKVVLTAPTEVGQYVLQYYAVDGYNEPSKPWYTRLTVTDNPPIVELNGGDMDVPLNGTFNDPGAKWTDITDGSGTIAKANEELDTTKVGPQTLTYSYTDSAGNTTTVSRVVTVVGNVNTYELTVPTKTEYNFGDKLDVTGAQIKVIGTRGEVVSVISDTDITADMFTNFKTDSVGQNKKAIFEYEGEMVIYKYNVNDFISRVQMTESPEKTEYEYGEELDLTGAKINVTMASGATEQVDLSKVTVVNSDWNKELGEQIVILNYENKKVNFMVNVNKRNVTIKINNQKSTYGDSIIEDLTYVVNSGSIIEGDDLGITLTKDAGTDAKDYTISGTASNPNYNVTFINGIYTIEKANIDMTGVSLEDTTVGYDGTSKSLEISGNLPVGVEGVTYKYLNEKQEEVTPTEAGEYTVVASFTVNNNYNKPVDLTAKLTVSSKVLSNENISVVAPTERTYTGTGKEANYVLNGVTTDDVNVEITYTQNGKEISGVPTNAGDYTAIATITPKTKNYSGTGTATVDYTIEKAEATVIANAQEKVYDGQTAVLSQTEITTTGVVSGETLDVTLAFDENVEVKNANTYTINVELGNNPNYNVTTANGIYTIEKATPVYNIPTGLTAEYNQVLKDVKLPDGFKFEGDDTVRLTTLGENKFNVTFTPEDTKNYNIVSNIEITINVVDTGKPVITRTGDEVVTVEVGSEYVDAGATAMDNYDGDITANIVTVNPVDTDVVADYTVTYNVTDANGNAAVEVTRTVKVVDTTPPVVTVEGEKLIVIEKGKTYTVPTATATDNYDENVTVTNNSSTINTNNAGEYKIIYSATDSNNNTGTAEITLRVLDLDRLHRQEVKISDLENFVTEDIFDALNENKNDYTEESFNKKKELIAELNDIINTNLKGILSICLQMIDKWREDNLKGNIINIGSIVARNGSKYFPIYSSSKAGIIAFSKSIASRYGEFEIRCNVISPGVIKTPMSYVETPNFDDYIEDIENKTPLKRLGNPNDIAKVALFLDSDNSEFITGQEIVVDGGYTLSQE